MLSDLMAKSAKPEFVRALIRREQDRQQLRNLLLDGATSTPGPPADATYFASLRERVHSGS